MSSIEIHRTDALGVVILRSAYRLRGAVATLVLLVFWLSFEPFSGGKTRAVGELASGNLVNQIGFGALFSIVVGACVTLVPASLLTRLLSFSWMVAIALLAMSVSVAPDPDAAMRAFLFTIFGIVTAAGLTVLPASAQAFYRALLIAGSLVLLICYLGLVIYPQAAIHQGGELESQHAGLWRGLYIHKNIAGPIMATMVFAGIYLFRRGMRWTGFFFTLAAFVFVINTGSKTSAALVPATVVLVLLPAMMGMRFVGAIVVLAAISATHALTIGTVFVPALDTILRSFNDTITFTGRTDIWLFAKDFISQRPLTGFGFDGFWETVTTFEADRYYDQGWDPRLIVHGHNGFLDVALQFGIPCLLVSIWLLVIGPAIAYARTLRVRENAMMADFFFMIVAFTGMNAALESFYFQRSDPVWLTLVIALFGLRMTSRFAVAAR